jgi:cystathionine beta-lyase
MLLQGINCKDEALGEQLHFQQFATGATLGPMDGFLVLRGIKTLHLRVKTLRKWRESGGVFKQSPKSKNSILSGLQAIRIMKLQKQMSGLEEWCRLLLFLAKGRCC